MEGKNTTVGLPKSIALGECKGWAVRELKLPRADMVDAIAGLVSVPAEFKAAYIAQVNLVPKKFAFIRFDAHAMVHEGKLIQHSDASGF